MDDWALSNDDRPTPRWLFYGLMLSAGIALISLILMAAWIVVIYVVPASWLP